MFRYVKNHLVSLLVTGAIAALLLFFPSAALGVTPAVSPDKTTYLLGETVALSGSIGFNQGEVSPISSVTLDIQGPQAVQQILPISPGHYEFASNNLGVDVAWDGIAFGYGYGYDSGAYSGVSGSQITYDIAWDAPIFLDPAPVYSVIPQTAAGFDIPTLAPEPTPTPGGPVDLPSVTQLFPIPQVQLGGPAPGAPPELPTVTEAFSVPAIPTPTPVPGAPAELPTVTEAFAIPQIPEPQPPAGVPTLDEAPNTALAFSLPTSQMSYGLASDGTDFYVVVDGANPGDPDQVLKVDSSGTLLDTLTAPSDQIEGIAYLNNALWVADNLDLGSGAHIRKLDPATGNEISSFSPPEQWTAVGGIGVQGTSLWLARRDGCGFWRVSQTGAQQESFGTPCDPHEFYGVVESGGFLYTVYNGKVQKWNNSGQEQQSWNTALTNLRGSELLGDVLYLLDSDSTAVFKTAIPSGITISTNPLGITYDGANIWALIDATPVDKIAKLDPSDGSLVASYDSPGARSEGITYLNGFLWVATYDDNQRKAHKIDPTTGNATTSINVPSWQDLGGLSNDGANLISVNKSENWDVKVFNTSGQEQQSLWLDGNAQNGATGLAYDASGSRAFIAKVGTVMQGDSQFKVQQTWNTTLTDIQGQTFYGDVLYMADAGTDKVYKASIPPGISVTTSPLGITHDGTSVWLLIDATPVDKIAKVDPSNGSLVASYDSPSSFSEGITYLNGYLWVGANDNGRKAYKIDPATGSSLANISVPGGGDIGGLTNDGVNLVAVEKNGNEVKFFDTLGNEQQGEWVDGSAMNGTTGVAFDASGSRAFIAKTGTVMRVNTLFDVQQTWNTTLTDIQGQTYYSDVLYMADSGADKVYKASVPSGIGVTVNPRGMAYGGGYLWILVDGTPVDRILKVNPTTGALVDSFDASSSQADAIAYLGDQLFVAVNQTDPCCSRSIVVHNPATGAQVTSFSPPGGEDVSGLSSDGTYLLSGPTWGGNVQVFDATGQGQNQFWMDGTDGVGSLAFDTLGDRLFTFKGNKVYRYGSGGGQSLQQWTTTLTTISGAAFVGEFVYMADAAADAVYGAAIPTPPVSTTTVPKGMATDGTDLYILVDGSPFDKVLQVSTTGALLSSFDAPGNSTDAIDYLGGSLYIAVNDQGSCPPDCGGFQPKIYKVNKNTGAEETSFNVPNVWDKITGLANDGANLIVGRELGGGWVLVDPNNPGSPQEQWQDSMGFPWMDGFQAFLYAQGDLYGVNGNLLNRFNKDSGQTLDSWNLQGSIPDVKGLAYIGTTLYIADASANSVRASTFPGNPPELTIQGDYQAQLIVQSNGQTVESSLASFTFQRISQVVVNITQPAEGFSSFTPGIAIAGNLNDPSVAQVNVGVDLPFTTLFEDEVVDPGSQSLWDANGLWHIACQQDPEQLFPKSHSYPCAWYYGQDSTQNYETGNVNAGDLMLVGPNTDGTFTIGQDAGLGFMAWWDTEPGLEYDRKQVQVSTDGGSTWQTIAMILGPFDIDPLTGQPFAVPGDLQGQNIKWIPIPPANFGFGGGMCPPKCDPGFGGGQPIFDTVNINLSPFMGQDILIRFHFDTVDAGVNQLEGWYIDDVKIGGAGFQGTTATVTPVTDPTLLSQGIYGTFDTTFNLAEGINIITARAVNPYDPSLIGTDQVTGFLDTTPPDVDLNPMTSPTNTPSATLSGSIEDVNFDQLVITQTTVLGAKTIITLKDLPEGNTFSKTVSLVEGTNVFEATATDGAGLQGSDTISVVLDTTGPVLSVLNPSYPIGVISARSKDPVIFNVTASDEGSGVDRVEIVFPGGPGQGDDTGMMIPAGEIPEAVRDLWGVTGDWILPVKVPPTAPPGAFSLTVRAYDNAGNQTTGAVTATVVPTLEAFAFDLMPDWNLVSLPLIPDTADIATLTEGVAGIESIWYYDASLADVPQEDRWLLFSPDAGDTDTLTTLGTGKGYWFKMDPAAFELSAPLGPGLPQTPKPIKFSYTGMFLEPGTVPPAYTVEEGWNNIGFHSEHQLPVTTALQSLEGRWGSLFQYNNRIVFVLPEDPMDEPEFEILLGSFGRLLADDDMTPGFGYWLFMMSSGVIVP